MPVLHRSRCIVAGISLVLLVLLATSCAPAATPTATPTTAPSPTPAPMTVPLPTPTITEPLATTPEEVPVEVTEIVDEEDGVPQRIEDLSQLPFGQVEHVEVVYFHLTQRCSGCIEAERLTRKTLDTYFADRLKTGEMSLVVADIQNPQNGALVLKYDAYGPSLYLGIVKGGIEYIWPFYDMWLTSGDEAKFMASLRDKIDIVYYGLED